MALGARRWMGKARDKGVAVFVWVADLFEKLFGGRFGQKLFRYLVVKNSFKNGNEYINWNIKRVHIEIRDLLALLKLNSEFSPLDWLSRLVL